MIHRSHATAEFLAGARAQLPLLVGVISFGMIYGATATAKGMPPALGQSASAIIFAGSSQFIAAQLSGVGAPGFVILLSIVVVNLRHLLYSASIAPHVKHLSKVWKFLLSYLLVDETYALAILHYNREGDPSYRHWYYLGAGVALWTSWQLSTALGILAGSRFPEQIPVNLIAVLTFIALVVPAIRDRQNLVAALVSGISAIYVVGLPYKLGLLVAVFVGITAGMLVDKRAR